MKRGPNSTGGGCPVSDHGTRAELRVLPFSQNRVGDPHPWSTVDAGRLTAQRTPDERRSSSPTPVVPARLFRGVAFAFAFSVPFWLLVGYAAVRGIW
jgi:hypothetical protein